MYQFKKIIFLVILSLPSLLVIAQPKSFSRNPEKFVEEISLFLYTAEKSIIENTVEVLNTHWKKNLYNEAQKRILITTSNEMLMNNLELSNFVDLFKTVVFAKDSIANEKFEGWLNALVPAVKSGNKSFLNYVNSSKLLFTEKTLYQSSNKKWISNKDNYVFEFQKNRVRISFKDIDLTCQTTVDNITIYNTSGSFYLDEDIWEGVGGKMDWERVGFGKDNVYVEFDVSYSVKFDRAEINIDKVKHTNKGFLDAPIYGTFKDRASSAVRIDPTALENASFPQFESFDNDLQLGAYLNGQVRFKGGYTIKGSKVQAKGSANKLSYIEIDYKGKLRVKAASSYFSLSEGRIIGNSSEITILTDSGMIYHPKAKFDLNIEKKFLLITRGKEGLERAPFFDTDKDIEIFVDIISWNLDLPKIDFKMSNSESAAIIESSQYYKDIRYEKITRGMLAYHPLSRMRDFVIKQRKREFTFTEYAAWMNAKRENLIVQIIELADLGYIFFNIDSDTIKVRKKLDHAVLSHMQLMDYDILRFSSKISARPNAYLDLINNNLELEGVVGFKFSDSQKVYVFPYEQMVTIKHKKKMEFGGKLTAGKFDFFAKKYVFDYHDFTISSDQIDSLKIYVPDFEGENRLVAVKSVLTDISGILEIDNSNNKSGLKSFPKFPRFTSNRGSVISYDKPSIYNGAYSKDKFRFEVDPFVVDNMNNFNPKDLKFPGTFVSGGILPEFRYEAGIMPDYSLGFEKPSPPGGYPMYGGLGNGEITIKLSEEGFTASGNIDYQGAIISSNNIVLMPDSTIAEVQHYRIKENDRYPHLVAKDVSINWEPYKDSMKINTNSHNVTVLRESQQFVGNLVQTSKQLSGNGTMSWEKNKFWSTYMKFKPNGVKALESGIEIGAPGFEKVAFTNSNLWADIDFNTRKGQFKANDKGLITELPFNAFATSMDEFLWDMNAATILFTASPGLSKEQSYFISKNPEQKMLSFQSDKALFDMNKGIIYAENVPFIDVADSRVFPDELKVNIEENGKIQTLKKANILANRKDKFYDLYNATLDVYGRYNLGGTAYLKFKDKHQTQQELFFNKIFVKNDSTLLASGFIADSLNFLVSPKIGYKGKMELWSNQEFINFNGYVKPIHTFEDHKSLWFRYSGTPDPKEVIIPAINALNEDRRGISVNVSIANDSTHIYPTFFNFKRSYADLDLTINEGIFFYDESKKTFFVGDSMKLLGGENKGSFLSFNETTREIFTEGKINFGLDLDVKFNGLTAGNLTKKEGDSTFVADMVLALNMLLPGDCYKRMAAIINENSPNLNSSENNSEMALKAFSEFLEGRKLKRMLNDVEATNELRPAGEFERDFLITKMSLHYSPSRQAFISNDPVHFATIKNQQVNRQVNSIMAISRNRSGTRFIWKVEVTKYDWFYFEYYRGTLFVYSTDNEFNEAFKKERNKLSKGKYKLKPTTTRTANQKLSKLGLIEE